MCVCVCLTGSSMLAMAAQTLSRATLAPTAFGTGTVGAGPRNSSILTEQRTNHRKIPNEIHYQNSFIWNWYRLRWKKNGPHICAYAEGKVLIFFQIIAVYLGYNLLIYQLFFMCEMWKDDRKTHHVIIASSSSQYIWYSSLAFSDERHKLEDDTRVVLHFVHQT